MAEILKKFEIKNVIYTSFDYQNNPEITKYLKSIDAEDVLDYLPKKPFETVQFELANTHTAFANAIRRVLVEDLPTYCLTFNMETISTENAFSDDKNILIDDLLKNINLIPIDQEHKYTEADMKRVNLELVIKNTTTEIMTITTEMFSKNDIISNKNIIIARLRPGKYLKLTDLYIERGCSKDDAGKFSLLNNVSYRILGIVPYDQFTEQGVRSMNMNPTNFEISFQTCGNVSKDTVLKLLKASLSRGINYVKEQYTDFLSKKVSNYNTNDYDVVTQNKIIVMKIKNCYFTETALIAQRCHILDPTGPHYSGSATRYDNNEGVLKIAEESKNTVLVAIESILNDIEKIKF